jgi:Zn-dependent metalloprotease
MQGLKYYFFLFVVQFQKYGIQLESCYQILGGYHLRNLRKLGILTLSTGLSIGILAPGVSATTIGNEQQNKGQVQISQAGNVVTKNDLLKIFRKLFPQFNNLKDSEFRMGSGHQYPEDDSIRYELSFHKTVNGKQVYGSVGFVGEKLEIERFYFEPTHSVDALFPAKVTKEKAKEVAQAFLKKFPESEEYQLESNANDYFPSNQILTEPIRYTFSFVRTKNEVPISDQRIQVTVLGNGEVSDFYRTFDKGSPTYDDIKKVLPKNDMISKIKNNLAINLFYNIDYDYRKGTRDVKLVYQPTREIMGLHAISGEWQTVNGYSSELPKNIEIKRITEQAIQPIQKNISLEEAKAFAEKILAIDSKDYKLRIESIDERKNHNGQEVISIHYMYESRNGGTGTSLEIDKLTGEVIQYHDLKAEVLKETDESKNSAQPISSKAALDQAVKYLKQFSPSYLHNYAMPTGESYFYEERGIYHFSFPRVVNGILVNGDQISVSVSAEGDLISLNVNQSDIKNWPAIKNVISKEKATVQFYENLNLELNYIKEGARKSHYRLVYTPKYSENPFSYLDANTGEWNSADRKKHQPISHPWAEKELNYLMDAGIIDAGDEKVFNANEKLKKGAALEVIMKSLSRFYIEYPPYQKNEIQSFENIKPDHPLYQVVERAVSLGVLKKDSPTINLDQNLTKEELAVWYIRILGLSQAAENKGIYQLKFADAKEVKADNIGFVALAHSLGLLKTSKNYFKPKLEMTYADLAVSTVRLAREVYKKGIQIHY